MESFGKWGGNTDIPLNLKKKKYFSGSQGSRASTKFLYVVGLEKKNQIIICARILSLVKQGKGHTNSV